MSKHTNSESKLPRIIDEIWHTSIDKRILSKQLLPQLNEIDILILAGWDTAAIYGPAHSKLFINVPDRFQVTDENGIPLLEAQLISIEKVIDSSAILRLVDSHVAVSCLISSPYKPEGRAEHNCSDLLIALELIRDYLDASLYLPHEMRVQTILEFARQSNLAEKHLRLLALRFNEISQYVYEK